AIVDISHRLFTSTARQIWMHHIALDRSRTDDRHLYHHAVKTPRFHPRQRAHLRAALDLKHPNGVGVLHDREGLLVVFWNVSEIERPPALATHLPRVRHHRDRAPAEQ